MEGRIPGGNYLPKVTTLNNWKTDSRTGIGIGKNMVCFAAITDRTKTGRRYIGHKFKGTPPAQEMLAVPPPGRVPMVLLIWLEMSESGLMVGESVSTVCGVGWREAVHGRIIRRDVRCMDRHMSIA